MKKIGKLKRSRNRWLEIVSVKLSKLYLDSETIA